MGWQPHFQTNLSMETLGQWTRMMNEETPFFASLPEDPRFLTPAQQICGEDVLGNGTDAHFSVGNTDWHSDSNWQPDSEEVQLAVKYHFHLDPVTAETGALRFIPGSHLLRGADREIFQEALDKVPLESVPCQAVPTQPGDVVLFDIRTWHASLGGNARQARLQRGILPKPRYYRGHRNASGDCAAPIRLTQRAPVHLSEELAGESAQQRSETVMDRSLVGN